MPWPSVQQALTPQPPGFNANTPQQRGEFGSVG
jgi:hypothetical protein